jgi:L-cysteine/cystine lyase
MIDIDRVRRDLPAVRAAAYLNAGTFGPMPTAVRDAVRGYLDEATDRGRIGQAGFDRWMGLTDEARGAFARALDADVEEVALTHSATDGINLVLSGLSWERGDEVVTTDQEHPGLTTPLAVLRRRHGVVVREAAVGDGSDAVAAVEAELSDRTRVVALSHVLWTTGAVLPVAELTRAAHDVGALLLVDGAQSLGAVPLNVGELGTAFYAVPGQKWLCGPSGTGALHVRQEFVEMLEPAWPWYGTDQHEPGQPPRLWPGARRFDAGTVSLEVMAGLVAAVAWRDAIGWPEAHARAATLARSLRTALADVPGVEPLAVTGRAPLVAFRVEGRDAAAVSASLEERGVIVRSLPGEILRAAVGFWNDERDLDRLLEALRAL